MVEYFLLKKLSTLFSYLKVNASPLKSKKILRAASFKRVFLKIAVGMQEPWNWDLHAHLHSVAHPQQTWQAL